MSETDFSAFCAVESCSTPRKWRGWCKLHYQRWYRTGDPCSQGRTSRTKDPDCSVDGCERAARAKTLCAMHYSRQQRGMPMDAPRRKTAGDRLCLVEDCQRTRRTRGYCDRHYGRLLRTGDPEGSVPRKKRVNGTGAGWLNPHGYKMLNQPDHPNARASGVVAEHVVVMSEALGRPLFPNENCHHLNGVRDDNRIENLELWTVPQPAGQRVRDLIEWANSITERYGTDPTAYP